MNQHTKFNGNRALMVRGGANHQQPKQQQVKMPNNNKGNNFQAAKPPAVARPPMKSFNNSQTIAAVLGDVQIDIYNNF